VIRGLIIDLKCIYYFSACIFKWTDVDLHKKLFGLICFVNSENRSEKFSMFFMKIVDVNDTFIGVCV